MSGPSPPRRPEPVWAGTLGARPAGRAGPGQRLDLADVGRPLLVGPTFLGQSGPLDSPTRSDRLLQVLEELPSSCPPRQLGPGPGWAAGGSGRSEARGTPTAGGPAGKALAPGPGRPGRLCQLCQGDVRQDDRALRLVGGWAHVRCWIADAPRREDELRCHREAAARPLAVARYLVAAQELGGMPPLAAGALLVPAPSAADNHRYRHLAAELREAA